MKILRVDKGVAKKYVFFFLIKNSTVSLVSNISTVNCQSIVTQELCILTLEKPKKNGQAIKVLPPPLELNGYP